MLPVAMAWSFDNDAICYMFLVLWMPSCFHIMGHVGKINQTTLCFIQVYQVAAPFGVSATRMGMKSAMSDCLALVYN